MLDNTGPSGWIISACKKNERTKCKVTEPFISDTVTYKESYMYVTHTVVESHKTVCMST